MKKSGSEIPLVTLLGHGPQESIYSDIDRRSDFYRRQARQKAPPPVPAKHPLLTPPNVLTFLRVIFVPVLMTLWFSEWHYAPATCAVLFVLQSITDWLDGYLARKLKITSAFGAFLDPVADKLMVSTTLILLSCEPPVPVSSHAMASASVIIIGREITMSALREWAAASGSGAHKAVKVNSLGKWKTAVQMVAMSAMLFFRKADALLGQEPHVLEALHLGSMMSFALLFMGALLGAVSLYHYMSNVWRFFVYPNGVGPSSAAAAAATGKQN